MTNGDDDQQLPLAWEKGKVIAQFLGVIANTAIAVVVFLVGNAYNQQIENQKLANTSVWPNPANEMVNVMLAGHEGSLCVFDLMGNRVIQKSVQDIRGIYQVSTKDLKPGVYFLQIQSGDAVRTTRIIIQ